MDTTTNFPQAFSLQGKRALITGGATGLGFAMAQCMVSAGASVILTGRTEPEKISPESRTLPSSVYYQFDVTDTENARSFVEKIYREQGNIDFLINNAGVHCKKPVQLISTEDMRKVLDVHVSGALALTQAVLPEMQERKNGSIIFISSMSAVFGLTQVAAYSAAKASILGMTRAIASEVSGDNVRVNAIIPGFIDSPMFREATSRDPQRQQKILGRTPMNRFGNAMDIGWGAVYLCSPAAGFITGTTLTIDGGCAIGF